MNIDQKLSSIRNLMREKGMDAYIIPSFDAHQSEYVPEHWKSRAWISGFTGSAGTVVVTMDECGLWTDGRYFIQAEKQLEGTEIKLFKMGEPGIPGFTEWIADSLKKEACVGLDSRVFSVTQIRDMEKLFNKNDIKINGEHDLIDLIWKDRPEIPLNKVYLHEVKYAGKSVREKLELVRGEMEKKGAENYLICTLDDIAWLYNFRGSDVNNTPVAISYALVSKNSAYLFMDGRKLPEDVASMLRENGVEIGEYNEIENKLKALNKTSIYIDPAKVNMHLYSLLNDSLDKVEGKDIAVSMKTIKNEVEIENLRRCHIKDGVAMVKFLYWLDNALGCEEIDEISAAEKLEGFRREQENFIGPSFDTIAGYKDHAAMMHYKASNESKYALKREGMFLVDSGGQYLDGTTDITRTMVLGEISPEEKRDFTLVVKGNIALSRVKFLHGVTGTNLDVLARQPIWEEGIDYKCGTGHGVGFLLSVHETPQRLSIAYNDTKLEKGMILTNEPGIYKEGRHGIRIENTLLVIEDEKTEFGQFMRFDVISYCPIDLEGIDVELLDSKEREWLNNYHGKVYEVLSPYLDEKEREWLKRETRKI